MRLSPTGYAVAVLSALSVILLGPGAEAALGELAGIDFDRSLSAFASLLLLALSAWVLTGIALSLASNKAHFAGMLARLVTPAFARRAFFLGAAGILAASPVSAVSTVSPMHGASSPSVDGHTPRGSERSVVSRSLDGLQLPDRPIDTTPTVSSAFTTRTRVIDVERGDTLWSIAARDLGPGASTAAIADAVKRWFGTNRSVIGADPDLIFPHQHLTPPTKENQ